eukprot:4185736-Ditylum_brightwellii.AAC.1
MVHGWCMTLIELRTNTPTQTLADGGGLAQKYSNDKTLCANAPRTFLNSETCTLSDNDNTCSNNGDVGGVGSLICGSPGEKSNDLTIPPGIKGTFPFADAPQIKNPFWIGNT